MVKTEWSYTTNPPYSFMTFTLPSILRRVKSRLQCAVYVGADDEYTENFCGRISCENPFGTPKQ
jgi:hypothetical protein